MKWTWFRKAAFGFTWGILAVLLGIVIAYLGYTNYSPFHVAAGSAWILLGVVGIMYAIYVLTGRRIETRDCIAVNSLSQGYSFGGFSPPSPKGRAERERKV